MDVSVIIPTYNGAEKLRLTLRALQVQSFPGRWEVIVVNNASTDHTDEVVTELATAYGVPLDLVHEPRPGASAARNQGARSARGGVLLFLDDDMIAPPDLVARHFETVTSNPRTWVLGQARYPDRIRSTAFGRFRDSLHALIVEDAGLVEVDSFASGNCSMPAEDLRLVGGYNEEFTTAALEDADLYVRARRHGRRVVIDPRIVAVNNDWAVASLEEFCRRQRIYSRSAPILQARFGDDHPRAEWVRKNSPASRTDSPGLLCNKLARAVLGTDRVQRGLYRAAGLLERSWPDSRTLRTIYRSAIAGSMYRGMGEGSDVDARRA
ncbi:MAG: glycosyltransferase [Acidimicrobiales bacterium]